MNPQTTQPVQPAASTSQAPSANFKSGIYWRKANGLPVILMLQNGNLSMKTQETEEFNLPLEQIKVRITVGNTLVIKTADKKYAFNGMASNFSKNFNEAQLQELAGYSLPAGTIAGVATGAIAGAELAGSANAALSGLGAASGAAGVIGGVAVSKKSDSLINQWRDALMANKANLSVAKFRGTAAIFTYTILAIIVFFGAIAIVAMLTS